MIKTRKHMLQREPKLQMRNQVHTLRQGYQYLRTITMRCKNQDNDESTADFLTKRLAIISLNKIRTYFLIRTATNWASFYKHK